MGFVPSKADSFFWYTDKGNHYEYIAYYVDDIIVYSKDTAGLIKEIERTYSLKGKNFPEYYWGGNLISEGEEWNDSHVSTALSTKIYIENIIPKFSKVLWQPKLRSYGSPMCSTCYLKVDKSHIITDPDKTKIYRSIIGVSTGQLFWGNLAYIMLLVL